MNRPSRSSTETGIVTRLVSILMTSLSSERGDGVGVVEAAGLRPLISTGGPSGVVAEPPYGSFAITGGVGVGATRDRLDVLVWADRPTTKNKMTVSTAANCFIEGLLRDKKLLWGKR